MCSKPRCSSCSFWIQWYTNHTHVCTIYIVHMSSGNLTHAVNVRTLNLLFRYFTKRHHKYERQCWISSEGNRMTPRAFYQLGRKKITQPCLRKRCEHTTPCSKCKKSKLNPHSFRKRFVLWKNMWLLDLPGRKVWCSSCVRNFSRIPPIQDIPWYTYVFHLIW